ncbi:flagellar assembly protein FliH [Marinobacter sp. C2H3]|uniref:flagellar assembly protein FliH n=1 Tax=Marinobacter sp. C2H3 TaxID=3119003 RepID=UPI00300EEF6B
MSNSPKIPQRIPKEQLTAYERWELPLLDADGNERPREEERDVRPLTAADLNEIRQAAREDGFQEGREAGYREGHAEGYQQGHQEGLAAGQEEGRAEGQARGEADTRERVDATLERLEAMMGELVHPVARHRDELEAALVHLTASLARAVLFRELTIDSSQIRDVVRKALAALPSTAEAVRIHVHPDDLEPVREVADRLESAATVVEDDSLLPGGCRVESRHSLVDYTVEKRFQKVIQRMLDDTLSAEPGDVGEGAATTLSDFHRDLLAEAPAESPIDRADDRTFDTEDRDNGDDQPPG